LRFRTGPLFGAGLPTNSGAEKVVQILEFLIEFGQTLPKIKELIMSQANRE
jgi:hypothetical protein